MGIGLSGINSGMDTDAIIEALVMEKTEKKNSLVKAQTKLQWKQDAWKALNNKIYSFYTKTLSNIRMAGSFNKKKVTVSNPNIATVTANSSSVNGTQSLAVEQLAKAGYLTGGQVSAKDENGNVVKGAKITGQSTMSDLGIKDSTSLNITVAGKETVINVNEDTTVSEFVSQLRSAGVTASFDETNQRFFISAKDSGKENDFSLTAADGSGLAALKNLGLYAGPSGADIEQYKTWAGYTVNSEDIKKAFNEELERIKADELARRDNNIKNRTEENESLQKEIAQLTKEQADLNYKAAYAKKVLAGTSGEDMRSVEKDLADYNDRINNGEKLSSEEQEKYNKLQNQMKLMTEVENELANDTLTPEDRAAYADKLTEEAAKKDVLIKEKNEKIDANKALNEEDQKVIDDPTDQFKALEEELKKQYTSKWNTAQDYMVQYDYAVVNSYDPANASLEEKAQYEESQKRLDQIVNDPNNAGKYGNSYSDAAAAAANRIGNIGADGTGGTGAVRIDGQNAKIYLNGALFEGSSNTVTVNGLTVTAQEITGKDNPVSITTSTDTEGIYNMVKDFFKGYNELINEMSKLYNADSARGYEPLTDEEKEAMTDGEIEKWETKIKDSLLRRDSSLSKIMQVMTSSLAGGVTTKDGTRHYLSEFGIATGGYLNAAKNERSAYHIDGDQDDSMTMSKTDKLMAAILEDPDHVAEVLSGIASNLYQNMTTAMRSTRLNSAFTVYNDKQMKTEYDSYTKKIAAQEEKVTWWEDYYRSKFTAMEKMLASLNSQQSSLSGLLGG